jgi:hypothetical protein
MLGGGLALASAPVLAQDTSDLMPTLPQPAPGQMMPYAPGAPLPPPPPREERAREGNQKQEERRGFYAPESGGLLGEEEGAAPVAGAAPPPEIYVVKRGDTLWDISAHYLGGPFAWPRLWALNPSVTNPHWIYPGDQLRLSAAAGPPTAEGVPVQPPEPAGRGLAPKLPTRPEVLLRTAGFVEPGELESAGKIIGAPAETRMLATLDEVYVEVKAAQPLEPGQRYAIYTPTRKVDHPRTGKHLGSIVEIFGDLEVKAVEKNHIVRGIIRDAVNPVERGYRVGPVRRRFPMPAPRPNTQKREATLVASLHPRDILGTTNVVFLDVGKVEGVELGNRFVVIRQGDGVQPLLARGAPVEDRTFPIERLGDVIVIDLRDHLSTGVILREDRETYVGDRLEAPRGY